jgi:micrococcal nuclease
MYEYRATLLRVIDGDTLDLVIDLGCFVSIERRIRLLGINTPELHDPDASKRVQAIRARKFVADFLPLAKNALVIHTELDKGDKYGRLLGTVYVGEKPTESVNDALIAAGLAVPFMVGA